MSDESQRQPAAISKLESAKQKDPKLVTEEEWRKLLTPEQFEITRKAGTEAPFTGKYDKHFITGGKYTCLCCGADLFLAENKFNSDGLHSQNPSKLTKTLCDCPTIHLGELGLKCADDGPPQDGGERYCINSCAINFNPDESK